MTVWEFFYLALGLGLGACAGALTLAVMIDGKLRREWEERQTDKR